MAAAGISGLTPAEVQYEVDHLDKNEQPLIMGAVGSLSTLATLSVLLFVGWGVGSSDTPRFSPVRSHFFRKGLPF